MGYQIMWLFESELKDILELTQWVSQAVCIGWINDGEQINTCPPYLGRG